MGLVKILLGKNNKNPEKSIFYGYTFFISLQLIGNQAN